MKEFTTPSGKILQLEEATFEDACELNSLICKELLNANISLALAIQEIITEFGNNKKISDITFSEVIAIPAILELVSRTFLSLISSAEVRNKIFKCLERSLLNKERITKASFEKENRGDFLFICKKCLEVITEINKVQL